MSRRGSKSKGAKTDFAADDTTEFTGNDQEATETDLKSTTGTSGKLDPDHDGGYGWIIVFTSFFVWSVVALNSMTYGIFISEIQDVLGWSDSALGVVGSLRLGFSNIAGLFSGPLTEKFGCRTIAMCAVLLSTTGHVVAALSCNPIVIMLSFGLMAGIGSGICSIPVIVIVQQYFTSKRALAASLSSVGLGLSAMIASPLTRGLINLYGLKGGMLIIGGINLQMLVPAAMFRPARWINPDSNIIFNTKGKQRNWLINALQYYFDRGLAKSTYFCFVLAEITKLILMDTYYVRLAHNAISNGIDPVTASFLPASISICTTTVRFAVSPVSKMLRPGTMYGLFNGLAGAAVFFVPVLPYNLAAYVSLAVVYGICSGVVFGISSTCLVTLVGLDYLPLALSWIYLSTGTSRILGNLFVGWSLDAFYSYSPILWVTSSMNFLTSFAFLFVFQRSKGRCHRKRAHPEVAA